MVSIIMEVAIVIVIVLFRIFAGNVMYKVLKSLEGDLLEIIRREADLVAVHQDTCQLDPVGLGEFHG